MVSAATITRVQPKRAATKKTDPKKVILKKETAPKKFASKKAVPKRIPTKRGTGKEDPVETILAKMAEMYQIGMKEVDESILLKATGYSRHDSTGYRNATKKVIKELGHVGKKKTTYTLTQSGFDYLVESGVLVIPEEPKNNRELHEQLLQTLEKLVVAPKAKIEAIFETFQDGEWHTVSELLDASGYGRTDSNGYRNIMAGLKKLDLLEKEGKKSRFNDKAFKFGRP